MRSFVLIVLHLAAAGVAQAQQLYPAFREPSFFGQPNTEYSDWDIFYAPHTLANKPDIAAPNGSKTTATAAGKPTSSIYSPENPSAFWSDLNPTITQVGTPTAFIVGPQSSGNIYSFSAATSFVLRDAAPFALGTVVLQFQTEGDVMDYAAIRLVYNNGGTEVALAPSDIIKEFKGSGSAFGGLEGRSAMQWDLSGLGITSYEIRFASAESSLSLQRALLDTSAGATTVIPGRGIWNAGGGVNVLWSNGANWLANAAPAAGANVIFSSGSQAMLDLASQIGELTFNTAGAFTLAASGGSSLTINTGITAPQGDATHLVNAPLILGGLQYETIGAGSTVVLNGAISAGAYGGGDGSVVGGFIKEGTGTLIVNGNIGSMSGSMLLAEGVLKLAGSNSYSGANAVQGGTLVLAADSPLNSAGALGANASIVNVGASNISATDPPPSVARVLIEGPRNVGKPFTALGGNALVSFGGYATGAGASFSGNINLAATNNVQVFAQGSADRVIFSGNLGGGSATHTLTKTGAGTVVFSGNTKTYLNATVVQAGTLEISAATTVNGSGSWQVGPGATLRVNGTMIGAGALTLDRGTLTGSGAVAKAAAIDFGAGIAPGVAVGTLTFSAAQTWSAGGRYVWQITNAGGVAGTDWDLLRIDGAALTLNATSGGKFYIYVNAVALAGFDPAQEYQWEIARAGTAINAFSSDAFAINANGFPSAYWNAFSVVKSGNSLYLKYTPTPGADPGPDPDFDPNPESSPDPDPTPAPDGGRLFVADGTAEAVTQRDAVTGAVVASPFVSGVNRPAGLAIQGSNLLVSSFGAGTISAVNRFTGAGSSPASITGLTSPRQIVVSGQNLYVVNRAFGSIDQYDAATGEPIAAPLIGGLSDPSAVVPFAGNLLVADAGSGTVTKYDATTGALRKANFITGLGDPSALAVYGGSVFVADASTNKIGRYATNGSLVDASFITGLNGPSAMVVYGRILYVLNAGNGTIGAYEVSGTNAVTVNASLVTGLVDPVGLAAASIAPDVTSPPPAAITIKIPGKKVVKTAKASLKIKGTTGGPVVGVSYRAGTKGAFKSARGTGAWDFTVKKLAVGTNKITVMAKGADGSTASTTITIKRTAVPTP